MTVKCTKGTWKLKPETGAIFSLDRDVRCPIASILGLSFPDKDFEECVANAAVISKAANMYSLLIFIKSSFQCMYRNYPEMKGDILDYIEARIINIERDVETLVAYRPDNVNVKR